MNRRKAYRDMAKFRETCRKQRRRYYQKTANLYEKRRWTPEEDVVVIEHNIPDSHLSKKIKRSVEAIQVRRSKLKKEAELADDVD